MKRKRVFEICCPSCPAFYTLTPLGEKDPQNFNWCLNCKSPVFVRIVLAGQEIYVKW